MTSNLGVAFAPQIVAAAARHNLDPRLLAAVAAQETGGPGSDSGRNVVGDGGHGRGVFQIDDRWHAFARTAAAMDPARNADYAAGLLASNLERYGGDVRAALSAYNGGSPTASGTATTWSDGTRLSYADSVLRHYDRLAGSPDASAGDAAIVLPPGSAGGAASAPDIYALFGLFQQLAGSVLYAAAPLSLPQHQPLAKADEHDTRDLAPDSSGAASEPQ